MHLDLENGELGCIAIGKFIVFDVNNEVVRLNLRVAHIGGGMCVCVCSLVACVNDPRKICVLFIYLSNLRDTVIDMRRMGIYIA